MYRLLVTLATSTPAMLRPKSIGVEINVASKVYKWCCNPTGALATASEPGVQCPNGAHLEFARCWYQRN
ncbi:hypothetical protein Y032_0081g1477 [Ancylostoma ceylanicum]|nr:hypothetical protein Y032_0081g1477 [Ancylostoma ceylanicum]